MPREARSTTLPDLFHRQISSDQVSISQATFSNSDNPESIEEDASDAKVHATANGFLRQFRDFDLYFAAQLQVT